SIGLSSFYLSLASLDQQQSKETRDENVPDQNGARYPSCAHDVARCRGRSCATIRSGAPVVWCRRAIRLEPPLSESRSAGDRPDYPDRRERRQVKGVVSPGLWARGQTTASRSYST